MMKRVLGLVAAGMLLALGSVAAGAATNGPQTEAYGDWLLSCPPADAKGAHCVLLQQLRETLSRRVVFVWTLEYDAKGNLVADLRVPTGVLVRPGLTVQADPKSKQAWKIDYALCNASECQAVAPLSGDVIKALSAANEVAVGIVLDNGRTTGVRVSMKGFVAGLTALSAKHKAGN